MARALQEEMRDAESKKRSLEEQLDHMNAELSSLKQQEQKAQGKNFHVSLNYVIITWFLFSS